MVNLNKDVTIVVTTCRAFSDLWANNLFLLNKYWPQHPNVIYVSDFPNDNIHNFNVLAYKNFDYTYRLKEALKDVKTKYLLLTLDDYLINDYIKKDKIQYLYDYMDINNIDYCRLFKRAKVKKWIDKKRKLKEISYAKKCYEVNLYPGLWKTDSLKKTIYIDENIWKYEVRLTRRCKEQNLKSIACYDLSIFPFVDTIRKGKYLKPAYKFLKKEKLYISNRKVRTCKEDFSLWIRTFISHTLPDFLKVKIKNVFYKGKAYSDFADTDD